MDVAAPFRFVVEAVSREGKLLGDYTLTGLDFEPAAQHSHLEAMRSGQVKPVTAPAAAQIKPIPCAERGPPFISGFEVSIDENVPPTVFPREFFHSAVVRGSAVLVQRGLLSPQERFSYQICAFPECAQPKVDPGFELTCEAGPLRIRDGDLPRSSRLLGTNSDEQDLPVVIDEVVTDDAARLARVAGRNETGGMLLGRIRKSASSELFLQVSALIEAPESKATQMSLRLGPAAFAAVERILALRDLDESIVGWWHSHPHFCGGCPQQRRRVCVFGKPFFSEADRDVHRTLFPQAYSQALLISDLGDERPSIDLFGWRRGQIAARSFIQPAALSPANPTTLKDPTKEEYPK